MDQINLYIVKNEPLIYKLSDEPIDNIKRDRELFVKHIQKVNNSFSAPFFGIRDDYMILSENLDIDTDKIIPGMAFSPYGGTEYFLDGKEIQVIDIIASFRNQHNLLDKSYNIEDVILFNYFYKDLLYYELKKNFVLKTYNLGEISLSR